MNIKQTVWLTNPFEALKHNFDDCLVFVSSNADMTWLGWVKVYEVESELNLDGAHVIYLAKEHIERKRKEVEDSEVELLNRISGVKPMKITPEKMREIRNKTGKDPKEFGLLLKVGESTVKSWEYAQSLTQRQIDSIIPRLKMVGLYEEGEE